MITECECGRKKITVDENYDSIHCSICDELVICAGFVYQSDVVKKCGLKHPDAFKLTDPVEVIEVEPVTIWRRIYPKEGELVVDHNHAEDGHVEGIKPKPICENAPLQDAWNNYQWMKSFGYRLLTKVKLNPLFPGQPIGRIIN